MKLHNLLWRFRSIRFKTNLVDPSADSKLTTFGKKLRKRFIHDSYFEIEDDYNRLSRSSKVSYYALGLFLVIPSSLALFSPSTPTYVNLLSHHFKLSSMTLSWLSSNYLAFNLSKFGRSSLLANSRGFVGLIFTAVGVTGTLVAGDYSMISAYYGLLSSYLLLGLYNYLLAAKKLLPRCIFLPSSGIIVLNLATILSSLAKSYSVRDDLENTSDEEVIRRFEASSQFRKMSNEAESA